MPSDVVRDATPPGVTPRGGQRGSGHLVVWLSQPVSGMSLVARPSPACNLLSGGVDMRQHLSFLDSGKAAGGSQGLEPHSGNPTVWDRRGAYGNVNYGLVYPGTYRGNAATAKTGPTVARAVFLSRPRPRFALHGAQRWSKNT
jgi:hypothetical protein